MLWEEKGDGVLEIVKDLTCKKMGQAVSWLWPLLRKLNMSVVVLWSPPVHPDWSWRQDNTDYHC